MSAYESLAASYDRLTNDVPYEQILDFAKKLLAERGIQPRSVLDLACGTGAMSILLAKEGLEVIGVDMSEDMLTVASEKAWEISGNNRPFFVKQRMQRLALPQKVDWVFSGLDSINYLSDPEDCQETFRRVNHALEPGGVFLFDVNTMEKFGDMDGQIFLDEDDDVYCVWRCMFDHETRICTYGMDIFQRHGAYWQRSQEEHVEYAYTMEQLRQYLKDAGFGKIQCFGDLRMEEPEAGDKRVYFLAVKEKEA